MELTAKQKKHLKALGHKLNPLVQIGKAGVTPQILKEIDRVLRDHELVKVKVSAEDQASFKEAADKIAKASDAHVVQLIGHIVLLFRQANDTKIDLP